MKRAFFSLFGSRFIGAAAGFAAAVGASACGNPAVDSRIAALGDEVPNIKPSEFHRAGQPCELCHSKYGGAEPEISVGGTIFATPLKDAAALPTAVQGAVVTLIDAEGVVKTATTNCAGTFFMTREQWDPSFPLRVELSYPPPGGGVGLKPATPMSSRISRDGSCAGCHFGPRTQGTPGYVFCEEDPSTPFPVPSCPEAGVP